jgi:hypothetical protein
MSNEDRDMAMLDALARPSSPVDWGALLRPPPGPLHNPNKHRQCFPVTAEVVVMWLRNGYIDSLWGESTAEVVTSAGHLMIGYENIGPAYAYLTGYQIGQELRSPLAA